MDSQHSAGMEKKTEVSIIVYDCREENLLQRIYI